jgi:hypothetical protein
VSRYRGDHKVKNFSCWEQFLCLLFAQLSYRESLRDIQESLAAGQSKLYHMGFHHAVRRNTLAHANTVRPWHIYADFAQILIRQAQNLYAGETLNVEFQEIAYALDSTTIDVCLSLFPWAHFRRHKGAIKLHTLLDIKTQIPNCIAITHGKIHDVNMLDWLVFEPGAFYIMDRAYLDFSRLYQLHQTPAFFVSRMKDNADFRRLYSCPVDKSTGLLCDQVIVLQGPKSSQNYPEKLRRIGFRDPDSGTRLDFVTNNFLLPALTIAVLYHHRWRIELFFKWIKQHLRIKSFYGTTENAVKTQIWIAIAAYVLVAIVKRQLALDFSLYTILQVFSVHLFEKTPIQQAFSSIDYNVENDDSCKQLKLFN